jgi:predicted nuclease with TOPRIM domain
MELSSGSSSDVAQLVDNVKKNVDDCTKRLDEVVRSNQNLCDRIFVIEEEQKKQKLRLEQQQVELQELKAQINGIVDKII